MGGCVASRHSTPLLLRPADTTAGRLATNAALASWRWPPSSTLMRANQPALPAPPQVLNVLAPVQLSKGDRPGAEQMLQSALTLGKSVGDLPTLVTASAGLQRLFAAAPGDAERAASQLAYTQRKGGELAAAVAAAAAGPHHAALLAWAGDAHGAVGTNKA